MAISSAEWIGIRLVRERGAMPNDDVVTAPCAATEPVAGYLGSYPLDGSAIAPLLGADIAGIETDNRGQTATPP